MKENWDDCTIMGRAGLLAYDELRSEEELKLNASLHGAKLN